MTPLSAMPSNMPPDVPSKPREAGSALVGGGAIAGVATGASIGGMVAGPVGIVVGATLGAVAGALGGQAAGAAVNPEESHSSENMATTVTPRK